MRIARDFGTVALLFPEGVTDLRDCPHTLFEAIQAALVYISFEQLPEDERPPRNIWGDSSQLKEFFEGREGSPTERVHIEGPVERNAAVDMLISD